jgi:hypothetical protein
MNLKDVGSGAWTGLMWLKTRTVAFSVECGNVPSGSINAGKLLTG